MTRRLLAMLGFESAAAQVVTTTECKDAHCGNFEAVIVKPRRKPANGECPVCGTVAPKFTPIYWGNELDSMTPTANLIRCAHCSAAFYQDAEPRP